MSQPNTSTRLLILIGLLSALLAAIGDYGLYGIQQSNAALRTVYEDASSLSDSWPAAQALHTVKTDEARKLYEEKISPIASKVQPVIDSLIALQTRVAKEEYDAGVLFTLIFGLALIRSISRSLSLAIDATNAVAQGNLSHPIEVLGQDEIAQGNHDLSTRTEQQRLGQFLTCQRQEKPAWITRLRHVMDHCTVTVGTQVRCHHW